MGLFGKTPEEKARIAAEKEERRLQKKAAAQKIKNQARRAKERDRMLNPKATWKDEDK